MNWFCIFNVQGKYKILKFPRSNFNFEIKISTHTTSTYMVAIILHEKLLVCRREVYLSLLPSIISRYKICKPLCLVTKLIIEVSLLTKMVCVAAMDKSNKSIFLSIIRMCLPIHFRVPSLKIGEAMQVI
jgi:hypothetical protein